MTLPAMIAHSTAGADPGDDAGVHARLASHALSRLGVHFRHSETGMAKRK
jgi:hypothetical protein